MASKVNTGESLLYQTADGLAKIEVTLVNETVWLTIDQMATLFQRNKSTISRHIKDAFESGELNPDSTVAFFATVQQEGERNVNRDKQYYNLDMSDWIQRLDDFLKLSGKELLHHAGTISAKLAKEKADAEYDKFEERTRNDLSPVELHFIENFERERLKLTSGNAPTQK